MRGCPVHSGMYASIPGLCPVDVPHMPPIQSLTTKKISRSCSVSSRARSPPGRTIGRGCLVTGPCLLNPETKQNATGVVHSFSCSASSSCCLMGSWQQVTATELQVTLIRLRDGLGGMTQTLPCSPAAFLAPSLVFQVQTQHRCQPGSLGLLLIENFPGHFWLLGLFHFTLTYYYIFKDTEI